MSLNVVAWTTAAYAESDEDRAGARAAAMAGASAMAEGRIEEAGDLFARAESLMHAPTHLLYLARCQAKLGRLVKARENYLKITREALPSNAPKAFVDAQAAATTEAAELESRIPTVKVLVEGDGANDAIVTMDGQKMSAALTGVPFPIDPGEHKFQARTKELESEIVGVTCAEGTRQTLSVSLRLSLRTEVRSAAPTPAPVSSGPAAPPADADSARSGGSGMRTGAFVAFGVGAVGLVAGTVFMLQNRSNRSDADALCPGGQCPQSKSADIKNLDSKADSAATLAWVGYGVGVVGVAAGATLWVLSSKSDAPKRGQLHPVFAAQSSGGYVGLGGTY